MFFLSFCLFVKCWIIDLRNNFSHTKIGSKDYCTITFYYYYPWMFLNVRYVLKKTMRFFLGFYVYWIGILHLILKNRKVSFKLCRTICSIFEIYQISLPATDTEMLKTIMYFLSLLFYVFVCHGPASSISGKMCEWNCDKNRTQCP